MGSKLRREEEETRGRCNAEVIGDTNSGGVNGMQAGNLREKRGSNAEKAGKDLLSTETGDGTEAGSFCRAQRMFLYAEK